MSPELLKVVARARREPEGRFHSLAHLIDVPALGRAYRRNGDSSTHDGRVTKQCTRVAKSGVLKWTISRRDRVIADVLRLNGTAQTY
jgi:hypothetical protein